MAAAVPPDGVTVHTVLFGDIGSAARVQQVARALDEQAVAKGHIGANLTAAGYGEVHAQLARLVDGMVNADLGPLILTAWSTWDRLIEAANATAGRPERTELVTLDEQRIVSERAPAVDVLIDGAKVASFTFALRVEFAIRTLVAVVQQSRLVAVRSGSTTVTGVLAIKGGPRPLVQGQREIDLPLVLNLGTGIALPHQ